MKWLLNSEIEKERRAGFSNPKVWIRAIDRIGDEFLLKEDEKLECMVFVIGAFCERKSASFKLIYLLRLKRLAVRRSVVNSEIDEIRSLAFSELAKAVSIKLSEKKDSGRKNVRDFSLSPMEVFLDGLRDRLGASPTPLPVEVR